MDTVRSKIYGVHAELATALSHFKKVETDVETKKVNVKYLEKEIKDLSKQVDAKQNKLDKLSCDLKTSLDKLKEYEERLQQAKIDIVHSDKELCEKATKLNRVQAEVAETETTLRNVVEQGGMENKARKELEIISDERENTIESYEKSINESFRVADETMTKRNEALDKIQYLSDKLLITMQKVDSVEKIVDDMNKNLDRNSQRQVEKIASNEKSYKKSGRKHQKEIDYLTEQVREAERRADVEEDVVKRMEMKKSLITFKLAKVKDDFINQKISLENLRAM